MRSVKHLAGYLNAPKGTPEFLQRIAGSRFLGSEMFGVCLQLRGERLREKIQCLNLFH